MNTTSEYLPDFAMKLSFPEAKQCAVSKPYLTWQYWGLGGSNTDIAEHLLIVHWSDSGRQQAAKCQAYLALSG